MAPRAPAFDESAEVEHVGTASALRGYGIPVPNGFRRSYTDLVVMRGVDGCDWKVWAHDEIFVFARRARTEAERAKWLDDVNANVSSAFFSLDRQEMCVDLAWQLHILALEVASDKPTPRALRRRLRQQLSVFAKVQLELTQKPTVDMPALRARLAAVGAISPQRNFVH